MADIQDTPEVDADAIRAEFEAAVGRGGSDSGLAGNSKIAHVIGVVSGKGGVGKSFVTGVLATQLERAGKRVGIMDADITGPSIPRMFGLAGQQLRSDGTHIIPARTASGIPIVSANLMLENESDPVVWRGPMLAGTLEQFWGETLWGELDYLLIDMPPGTGDVALTVFQSLPVDGLVIVSSPQDLVQMVVGKAVKMAAMMEIPVLGLVENMSYAICGHCGEKVEVFGKSHVAETAAEYNLDVLGKMPIDPALADACDKGYIEDALPDDLLGDAVASILASAGSR